MISTRRNHTICFGCTDTPFTMPPPALGDFSLGPGKVYKAVGSFVNFEATRGPTHAIMNAACKLPFFGYPPGLFRYRLQGLGRYRMPDRARKCLILSEVVLVYIAITAYIWIIR